MAKIKFTKGELKRQRDSLKQFRRYLPTLQLKKQQLQMKILEARKTLGERMTVLKEREEQINEWVGLLADTTVDPKGFVVPTKVVTSMVNIAGANVPIFEDIHFDSKEYDLYTAPFWLDRGIEEMRLFMEVMTEAAIIKKQIEILQHELTVTTQRVNLFEKIKIPESLENIRKIRIYLGDQQANAVGVGKVAKKKIEEKNEEPVLV